MYLLKGTHFVLEYGQTYRSTSTSETSLDTTVTIKYADVHLILFFIRPYECIAGRDPYLCTLPGERVTVHNKIRE